MDAKFDIFKKLPGGCPFWIATVEGLEVARQRMARFAAISPAEYFANLQGDGIVAEYPANSREWAEIPRRLSAGAQHVPIL